MYNVQFYKQIMRFQLFPWMPSIVSNNYSKDIVQNLFLQ